MKRGFLGGQLASYPGVRGEGQGTRLGRQLDHEKLILLVISDKLSTKRAFHHFMTTGAIRTTPLISVVA